MAKNADRSSEYALLFYDLLDKQATVEQLAGMEKGAKVFRGSITTVFKSLKISMAYYTPIKRVLEETESVIYLRAGNKSQDSCVVILDRPDPERLMEAMQGLTGLQGLTTAPKAAMLDRRITALEERLEGVAIKSILVDFEKRLRTLEGTSKPGRKTANAKSTQRN